MKLKQNAHSSQKEVKSNSILTFAPLVALTATTSSVLRWEPTSTWSFSCPKVTWIVHVIGHYPKQGFVLRLPSGAGDSESDSGSYDAAAAARSDYPERTQIQSPKHERTKNDHRENKFHPTKKTQFYKTDKNHNGATRSQHLQENEFRDIWPMKGFQSKIKKREKNKRSSSTPCCDALDVMWWMPCVWNQIPSAQKNQQTSGEEVLLGGEVNGGALWLQRHHLLELSGQWCLEVHPILWNFAHSVAFQSPQQRKETQKKKISAYQLDWMKIMDIATFLT